MGAMNRMWIRRTVRPGSRPHTISSERGGAYIELAICLPLLMIIFMGCLELQYTLGIKQQMSSIVREATNSFYRQCASSTSLSPQSKRDCILSLWNGSFNTFVREALPDGTFTISVFELQSGTVSRTVFLSTAPEQPTKFPSSPMSQSDFRANYLWSTTTFKPVVAISEAFLPHTAKYPLAEWLFPSNKVHYEVAIY